MDQRVIGVGYKSIITESSSFSNPEPMDGLTNHVANRLFVTNFDKRTTEEELRKAFQLAGEILDVNIVRGVNGARSYGFVSLKRRCDCEHLLRMKDRITVRIRGREITFSAARYKPRRNRMSHERSVTLPAHGSVSNSLPQPVVVDGTTYYNQPQNVDQIVPQHFPTAPAVVPAAVPMYEIPPIFHPQPAPVVIMTYPALPQAPNGMLMQPHAM